MFDLDSSTESIFKTLVVVGAGLLALAIDLFLVYISWRAIFRKLKQAELLIQILAVLGGVVVTAVLHLLMFWLIFFLLARLSGMSSIH